jgi:hypothetical protein
MGRGTDRRNTERGSGRMEVIQTQILRENLHNGNLLVWCYFEESFITRRLVLELCFDYVLSSRRISFLVREVSDRSSTHMRILLTHMQAKHTQIVLYQLQGCKESSKRFYGYYFIVLGCTVTSKHAVYSGNRIWRTHMHRLNIFLASVCEVF